MNYADHTKKVLKFAELHNPGIFWYRTIIIEQPHNSYIVKWWDTKSMPDHNPVYYAKYDSFIDAFAEYSRILQVMLSDGFIQLQK